ncbi:MAG: glycosyltransferase family 2 protein [Bacteroidota bacterium]
MKKVAVIILNWNGKDLLEKFLPTLVRCMPDYAEAIIADNGSTDNSVAFVKKDFPGVRTIALEDNLGFARGYHKALKQIQSEYYVLLNSDVEVTKGWIEPIMELMEGDHRIGACQPKILDYNNRNFFEYAGAAGGFIDKLGYPFCRGRILNSFEKDRGQYDDVKEIFWATGAALFIRSELYHHAGGFDEDFFAHMEEIDLCWRIKHLGYKVMYCPSSKVYHLGGGTLNQTNPKKTFLNFRNGLILLFKNHPPRHFVRRMALRSLMDGVAAIKFLLSGEPGHCLSVLKAYYSFYSDLGTTMRKRRNTIPHLINGIVAGIYQRSIIVDFFLRGVRRFSDLDERMFT